MPRQDGEQDCLPSDWQQKWHKATMEATDPLWHALGRQNKWLGQKCAERQLPKTGCKAADDRGKGGRKRFTRMMCLAASMYTSSHD